MANKQTVFENNNATKPADDVWLNMVNSEYKNLCTGTGQTPDADNSQIVKGAIILASQASLFCVDSGTTNNYVLNPVSPLQAPPSLRNGLSIKFTTTNANSGSTNINAYGFGNILAKNQDGSNLTAGDIPTNTMVQFYYNGTNWILDKGTKATTTTQGITYLLPNCNIIINGAMAIDQRNAGASQTITAGSALAYTIDRWYAYCTGANATGQRVAGTAPNQFNYRFTGASSITKIGFAQRIEASNSQHLAGKTATLSVDLANSLLTTITWTAWYANSTDTFGTLASPTRTQIATGTFTVNSTLTRYATSIAIPAGATTGIEIELSVGAQTSGTWTIGRAQLEDSPEQTTFEYRTIQQELFLCQRYYEYGITWGISYGSSGAVVQRCLFPYKVNKRTSNPSNSVSVLSGSLTSPSVSSINEYNAWIGFGSSGAGIDGSFGITINSEL